MRSRFKPHRRRVNAKGRNENHQYVNLPYVLLLSPAWLSLSGPAVRLWLLLRTRFTGFNNGRIILSLEEASRILHLGKATIQAAFKDLERKGFVVCIKRGQWYGRLASEWAVTDQSVNGQIATNAWREWKPDAEANENQNAVPYPIRRAS